MEQERFAYQAPSNYRGPRIYPAKFRGGGTAMQPRSFRRFEEPTDYLPARREAPRQDYYKEDRYAPPSQQNHHQQQRRPQYPQQKSFVEEPR
jgi:hypothetical protein